MLPCWECHSPGRDRVTSAEGEAVDQAGPGQTGPGCRISHVRFIWPGLGLGHLSVKEKKIWGRFCILCKHLKKHLDIFIIVKHLKNTNRLFRLKELKGKGQWTWFYQKISLSLSLSPWISSLTWVVYTCTSSLSGLCSEIPSRSAGSCISHIT